MTKEEQIEAAIKALHEWTIRLCQCAGEDAEAAEIFFDRLLKAPEILKEYAYYYDNQEFLCEYSVDGYTLADILVWQMDHFKAHMDRADSANRYDKDKLILSAFRTLLELRSNPEKVKSEFAAETGTDLAGGWNLH